MAAIFSSNNEEKIEYIRNLAAMGKNKKAISEELGYKNIKCLEAYIRRKGLVWDGKKGLVLLKSEVIKEEAFDKIEDIPTGKVASVISMLSKNHDSKETAKKLHFSNHQEMANFMKSKGYIWDEKKKNYTKIVAKEEAKPTTANIEPVEQSSEMNNNHQCNCMERFGDILKFLEVNKEKLTEMFKTAENTPNIPRYTLSGINIQKTIGIANNLDRLVKEFSEDKNISQKDMVEVALVEFLKKYGYFEQVKAILNL